VLLGVLMPFATFTSHENSKWATQLLKGLGVTSSLITVKLGAVVLALVLNNFATPALTLLVVTGNEGLLTSLLTSKLAFLIPVHACACAYIHTSHRG